MGREGGLYHVCEGPASKCKFKKSTHHAMKRFKKKKEARRSKDVKKKKKDRATGTSSGSSGDSSSSGFRLSPVRGGGRHFGESQKRSPDASLRRRLAQASDTLIQRFKALE